MRTSLAIALTGALTLGAVGCGGSDSTRTNELRPPAPILIAASVTPRAITASPQRFGAGPIQILVTNITGSSQQVTFESDGPLSAGSGTGISQKTGPINPQDTATITANVDPGLYVLRVGGDTVEPASIRVGRSRPSSQNDLMLP